MAGPCEILPSTHPAAPRQFNEEFFKRFHEITRFFTQSRYSSDMISNMISPPWKKGQSLNYVFQCIYFHMWNHRSELNPSTCLRGKYYIIFEKFLARIALQICRVGQSSILCHLRNLQPPHCLSSACAQGTVPLTPARLHVFVCSTWAFVAWVFGAWAFAVLDCSFDLSFSSLGFEGWSFSGCCQGVIRYRMARQALADTAKAW